MAPSPRRSDPGVPLGFGLGLRRDHYVAATSGGVAIDGIDWFEVITENFLVEGGNPRRVLRAVREHRPIVLHGVSLSIGSLDPLDTSYLDGVAALARELSPAHVSDHLCWTSLGGHNTHDLLPLPYTEEALAHQELHHFAATNTLRSARLAASSTSGCRSVVRPYCEAISSQGLEKSVAARRQASSIAVV